jgi:chaperonin GroEL
MRGMDSMSRLIRPTLGPMARTVAIAPIVGRDPEILDSGATIARRTIQLADPLEDMGGMIVRHLAWRQFETVGDGTATAVVLAQRLIHEANRCVTAGWSPVPLKRGIERGLQVALAELRRQARTIELPEEIAGVVAGVVRDPKVAEMIGEIVDSVGPDGAILVENAQATETVYEYVDGVRWNEGYFSSFFVKEGSATVRLLNPRILFTDHFLDRAEQLQPTLEACLAAGEKSVMVVAPDVKDSALSLLLVNRDRGVLDDVLAVKTPSFGEQRLRILEDLAVICGGRCVREGAGESLAEVTLADLGRARQAWAHRTMFGILGGQGDRAQIRARIAEAKVELSNVENDNYVRDKIKERIGKLAGTAAILLVGAHTSSAQAEMKVRVEAAVTAARAAVQDGVAAGGGAALLGCVPALEELATDLDAEERQGVRALMRALEEPMRTIAGNAGLEPSGILHEARARGPEWTFDVVREVWVGAIEAGIVDPLPILTSALETAVSAASVALTAEVLVHHRNPETVFEP